MTPATRTHDSQRVDAFVDAAFAFAVTLLIVSAGEPPTNLADLREALLRTPAFLASFALISLFWLGHRAFGRLAPQRDGWSTLLSLAVVFVVLVYVFPLRMLCEAMAFWMSGGRLPGRGLIDSLGDLRLLYVLYGLGFTALSLLTAGLFVLALGRSGALGVADVDRAEARSWLEVWAVVALAGLLSAGVALSPLLRPAPWSPGVAYWVIPAVLAIRGVVDGAVQRRRTAARLTEVHAGASSGQRGGRT